MEQRLEAVLAAQPFRGVRGILPVAGGMQQDGTPGPVLRQHDSPGSRLGCRRKRGQHRQAFGRSRGGFSTKIHLKHRRHQRRQDAHEGRRPGAQEQLREVLEMPTVERADAQIVMEPDETGPQLDPKEPPGGLKFDPSSKCDRKTGFQQGLTRTVCEFCKTLY